MCYFEAVAVEVRERPGGHGCVGAAQGVVLQALGDFAVGARPGGVTLLGRGVQEHFEAADLAAAGVRDLDEADQPYAFVGCDAAPGADEMPAGGLVGADQVNHRLLICHAMEKCGKSR